MKKFTLLKNNPAKPKNCRRCNNLQYSDDMVMGLCRTCWNEGTAKRMIVLALLEAIVIGFIIYFIARSFYELSQKTGRTMEFSQPVWAGDELAARTQRIQAYLIKKKSPLADYAVDFVRSGDRYGVDPYLLVGIARIESSLGVHYPKASNNPFGLSSRGGVIRFPSITHSIDYLGKTIGQAGYYRKYRSTKDVKDLAKTFCPPNWEYWTEVVTNTMGEI